MFNVKSLEIMSGGPGQEYLSPYGVITPRDCPLCKKPNPKVYVTLEQIDQIKSGELYIQNILFDKDADTRETIQTGICPTCWDTIMEEDDDDEEDYDF